MTSLWTITELWVFAQLLFWAERLTAPPAAQIQPTKLLSGHLSTCVFYFAVCVEEVERSALCSDHKDVFICSADICEAQHFNIKEVHLTTQSEMTDISTSTKKKRY